MNGQYDRTPSDPSPLGTKATPNDSGFAGANMDFGGDPVPLNRAVSPVGTADVREGEYQVSADPVPLSRTSSGDMGLSLAENEK